MEKMLTLKEVTKILGRPNDSQCRFVRSLRKNGYLKGVKIGKKILFKESDVEEFIEHQYEIQNNEIEFKKKINDLNYDKKSIVRSKYDENIKLFKNENLNFEVKSTKQKLNKNKE